MIQQSQFQWLVSQQLERAGMQLIGAPRLTSSGRVVADVDRLPPRTILERAGMCCWGRGLRADGVGPYVAFEVVRS